VSQSSSMPTAVIVRPAGVPDAAGLARIRLAAWRAAYRGIVPAAVLDALDPDAETARWRTSLSTPRPAFTRVAIAGSSPRAGPATTNPTGRAGEVAGFGEVYAIYVDPEVQGRGIGRALIEAGVRGLTARRFAEAILWVFEANAPARGFYEKMGWAADGAVKPFEIGGAAPLEVRYRRPLG
jgi:ribosomal protein S18 acetylase RimI-like enzyme